jgi:hypothetical protein
MAEIRRQLKENPTLLSEIASAALEQSKSNAQYAKELLNRIDGPVTQRFEVSQLTGEQVLESLAALADSEDENEAPE